MAGGCTPCRRSWGALPPWVRTGGVCPLSGEGREGLAAIAEVHHAAHVSRRRPLFPDALDGVLQLQEKGSARKFPRPWGAEAAEPRPEQGNVRAHIRDGKPE